MTTEPFEQYVDLYEQWFETNQLAYESELRAVAELSPRDGVGIEIGVGTGRFAAPLGIRLGVEPSEAMGAIARQRGIEVVRAVAESLPFADAGFDFALMATTLCFLDTLTSGGLPRSEGRRFADRGVHRPGKPFGSPVSEPQSRKLVLSRRTVLFRR